MVTNYTFLVSTDGKNWKKTSQGEFGNIVNNRIKQEVVFAPTKAKWIKLIANKTTGESKETTIGEIGVILN